MFPGLSTLRKRGWEIVFPGLSTFERQFAHAISASTYVHLTAVHTPESTILPVVSIKAVGLMTYVYTALNIGRHICPSEKVPRDT